MKTQRRLRQTVSASSRRKTKKEDVPQLLNSILKNIGEGVIVADREGRFLLFNPMAERMIGIGALESSIENWSQDYGIYYPNKTTCIPPDRLPLVRAIHGESVDGEILFIRNNQMPEGTYLSVSGRPLLDSKGKIVGGVVALRNVTQERHLQEEMKALLERMEERVKIRTIELIDALELLKKEMSTRTGFSALIYRQWKKPLQIIHQEIDNLFPDDRSLKDDQKLAARLIRMNLFLLDRLSESFLDYSKIELGKIPLKFIRSDITSLVSDACHIVKPLAEKRHISVEYKSDRGLGKIPCDARRLQDAIICILSKALERTAEGGNVLVSLEKLNSHLSIRIQDRGTPLPEKTRKTMEEVFNHPVPEEVWDLEDEVSEISVCKYVVARHQGKISAESSKGEGTSIRIVLPLS